MQRWRRTRRAVVGLAAVAASSVAGAASAYLVGPDRAEAAPAPLPLTVEQTSVVTGLVPGGAAQPLEGTFDNPHRETVVVRGLVASVVRTDVPSCDPSNFAITGSVGRVGLVPPGHRSGHWSGLSVVLRDDPRINQSDCEGARVEIGYTSY